MLFSSNPKELEQSELVPTLRLEALAQILVNAEKLA